MRVRPVVEVLIIHKLTPLEDTLEQTLEVVVVEVLTTIEQTKVEMEDQEWCLWPT